MAAMKGCSAKQQFFGRNPIFFYDIALEDTHTYRITAFSLEYRLFRLNTYLTVRKAHDHIL